jgi:hypothetical protein
MTMAALRFKQWDINGVVTCKLCSMVCEDSADCRRCNYPLFDMLIQISRSVEHD